MTRAGGASAPASRRSVDQGGGPTGRLPALLGSDTPAWRQCRTCRPAQRAQPPAGQEPARPGARPRPGQRRAARPCDGRRPLTCPGPRRRDGEAARRGLFVFNTRRDVIARLCLSRRRQQPPWRQRLPPSRRGLQCASDPAPYKPQPSTQRASSCRCQKCQNGLGTLALFHRPRTSARTRHLRGRRRLRPFRLGSGRVCELQPTLGHAVCHLVAVAVVVVSLTCAASSWSSNSGLLSTGTKPFAATGGGCCGESMQCLLLPCETAFTAATWSRDHLLPSRSNPRPAAACSRVQGRRGLPKEETVPHSANVAAPGDGRATSRPVCVRSIPIRCVCENPQPRRLIRGPIKQIAAGSRGASTGGAALAAPIIRLWRGELLPASWGPRRGRPALPLQG